MRVTFFILVLYLPLTCFSLSSMLFQIFVWFDHRRGCVHQGRPTLSRTSGPWASGIILHICQVSTKYLSSICQVCIKYLSSNSQVSFCAFVKANPDNPSFSLILELMELENIVANTVYLKVIFLSSIRYIRCILPSCHIVILPICPTLFTSCPNHVLAP